MNSGPLNEHTVLRKLLICPWFGPLPEWMPLWERNVATLEKYGYDVLRIHDLDWFKDRVRRVLGIECPIVAGEGKIHDYRAAFGRLFRHHLKGYDFWGHTDFDCVYGRVSHFIPDSALAKIDQFSNHPTYVSGPWSLYRNTPEIANLFRLGNWEHHLSTPNTTGWVEREFSEIVADELEHQWVNFQTWNLDDFSAVRLDGDRLMEGKREIMVAHFRRTKVYPERCR